MQRSNKLPIEVWLHITTFAPLNAAIALTETSRELGTLRDDTIRNFILNKLSHLDLSQALKFLVKFWQSNFYKLLKEKCTQESDKLTPTELFCLMLTREGDNHQLYENLFDGFSKALENKSLQLNTITRGHLILIREALRLSYPARQAMGRASTLENQITLFTDQIAQEDTKFLNFSGIDFSKCSFSMQLENALLNHANFKDSGLCDACFSKSSLCFADLSGAVITNSVFENCHFFQTKFYLTLPCTSVFTNVNFFSDDHCSLEQLKKEFNEIKPLLDQFSLPIAHNIAQQVMRIETVDNHTKAEFLKEIKPYFEQRGFPTSFFMLSHPHTSSADILDTCEKKLTPDEKCCLQ